MLLLNGLLVQWVMGIYLPEKCLRDQSDCEPLAQIASDCGDSFICVGCNDGTRREVEQDKYTYCWKTPVIDQEDHVDETDLLDTISVMSQAMSVINHQK